MYACNYTAHSESSAQQKYGKFVRYVCHNMLYLRVPNLNALELCHLPNSLLVGSPIACSAAIFAAPLMNLVSLWWGWAIRISIILFIVILKYHNSCYRKDFSVS